MEIIAMICALVLLSGLGAMILKAMTNGPGRFEAKAQPPETPETSPWITFRMRDGVIHIRAEEVRNFAYNYSQMTLVINDGTESPAVIPDPGYRHYARLCQRFGCLPMAKTLKGGRGRD